MRYAVIIEQAATGFSAHLPDLPGCVAAASTLEELSPLIREAVEFHVEGLRESGEEVPAPTVRVDYVDVDA